MRKSEIGNFGLAFSNEYISNFNIPMNDIFFGKIEHALKNIPNKRNSFLLSEGSFAFEHLL